MPRTTRLVIRLIHRGCANRHFFHVALMRAQDMPYDAPIEQLGVFDQDPNENNEKLVSFNFDRIKYWMAQGADLSKGTAKLLGLSGFLPIHPQVYVEAWQARRKKRETEEEEAKRTATTKSKSS